MFWVAFAASVILFLIAAKSHGRQLRLERELAGFDHVVFGGTNPLFVEKLWRKDRVQYWSLFALLMFILVATAFVQKTWDKFALFCIWTFVSSFTVVGIWSFIRFWNAAHHGGARSDEIQRDTHWIQAAIRGSFAWWSAVLVLYAAILFLTF